MMIYHASGVFHYIVICSVIRTHADLVKCNQSEGIAEATNENMHNIALGKSTNQSSKFEQFNSTLAVDGKTSTDLETQTCSHTGNDSLSSWTVILDNQMNITSITLYLRNNPDEFRYKNMRILIDGNQMLPINITNNNNVPYPNPVHISGCDHQLRGNNITILVNNSYLTLCEVQLWVCNDTFFGEHCEEECKCLNQTEVCDKRTGYCRSGCRRGWHGDGCLTECKNRTYGENCNSVCGYCQNDTQCEAENGTCPNGCMNGYKPPLCKDAVVKVNCTQSMDMNGATYDNMQNIALGKPTYQSSDNGEKNNSCLAVDGKTNTTYKNGTCTHTDNDTASSWTVILDNKMKYNITTITLYLRKTFPQRYKNMRILIDDTLMLPINITNKTNAPYPNPVHISGCNRQLRGNNITILVDNGYLTLCEVQLWACNDTFFGRRCENNCSCLNRSEVCDKTTGHCKSGCRSGWHGDGCLTECKNGTYGKNCNSVCGYCQNDTQCDAKNGSCPNGCVNGYKPPLCKDAVVTCTQSMGMNGATYDNMQNIALGKPTYQSSDNGEKNNSYLAVDGKTNTTYKNGTCTHTDNDTASSWTVILDNKMKYNITTITLYLRKTFPQRYKNMRILIDDTLMLPINITNKTNAPYPNPVHISGCNRQLRGNNITILVDNGYLTLCEVQLWACNDTFFGGRCENNCSCLNRSEVCDKTTGHCNSGCRSGWHGDGCLTEQTVMDTPDYGSPSQVGTIVGGVMAVLVLVVAVIGIVFFLRRRKASKTDSPINLSPKNTRNEETATEDGKEVNHYEVIVDHYYNNIPANISLDSLKQYVRSKTAEDGFDEEFKMMRYGLHGEAEVAKKPKNKERNRFTNLFPYDHSRVKLSPDGAATWDYINASFVSDYCDKTTFIAAQGPNPVTVDDFWRMIWQQNVRKIVMLTRLMEMRKKKCEQYWPECNEKKQCGNITIETTLSVVRADFTIRTFSIKHKVSHQTRMVTQFHFTKWPDHDVPSAPALVGFWKQVKVMDTYEQAGPSVVHCSAGVGRTGTFIALDSLVTQAETENRVNIFMCVAKMREARMNMVQTVDQYKFVYEVLLEALESRGTLYTLSDFDKKYGSGMAYTAPLEEELKRQFQCLHSLKVKLHETHVSDSLLPENVEKNRSMDILPGQQTRPYLITQVIGCNDYINAVILPSANRSQYFIATQTPLPETVVDFWRLVYDHHCPTIVCLDDNQDALSLYPREKKSCTVGPFTVKTVAMDSTRNSYVVLKMTVSHKDKMKVETRRDVLVYRTVSIDTTSGQQDTAAILEFFNVLITNDIGEDEKMLVQCFDGSRVCGVFCSLMNIISRLRLDKDVDIFLTIRELQTVRPQFVATFDQYKFCHNMVKEYCRSLNVYANM